MVINCYFLQVMLVSLKAGGVGLNLIGGNHLFLLDSHWYVYDLQWISVYTFCVAAVSLHVYLYVLAAVS